MYSNLAADLRADERAKRIRVPKVAKHPFSRIEADPAELCAAQALIDALRK